MNNSARTRSPRLSAALLPLLFAPVPALLAQDAPAPVAVPGDIRALLRDAQAAALPSASVITQEIGAVSVAPATTNDAAWFAVVGSGAAFAFEDPATDETVVTNPATGGAARLAPEPGYDPNWALLAAGYDVVTNADLLPFYDPSLVVLSLSLVPSNTVGAAANAASPTNSLITGWLASFHRTEAALSSLPDFSALSADLWLAVPAVDFPSTQGAWSGLDSRFKDYFAARFSGSLWIETPGDYAFHLASDDGAALWIDGAAVILDDAPHSYRTRSATVALSAGLHDIVVGFYENTGTAGLRLSWTPPGGSETVVPASAVLHAEPASYAPGIRLAAPDPAVCYVGNEVSLFATAWGFGETISRVDFFADGVLVSSVSNAPFAATWETAATGTVAVSAIATDSAGAVSIPALRTVEVLPCPPGYAAGLSSTYYPLSSRPGDLPDFSLLTPCQTRIEHSINHTEATSWPGVPVSATRLFASRHAGRLFVPATGDWTFLLESAEGSRLYLDGALVVDNGGAHTRRTRTGTVRLAYGFHDFEVLHFTQGAPPTLRLHWQPSGSSWSNIPQTRYFRVVGETDSDGDGAEDWWETEFGFDPSDPADAALDPDSDGLSNLAEFLAGTNPLLADSDGDGIPDAWEVARGLNPCLYSDAFADPDGDTLSNYAEFLLGTEPLLADTDGDGWDDRFESSVSRTDPCTPDLAGVTAAPLGEPASARTSVVARTGSWGEDESVLYARERAGSVTWELTVGSTPPDAIRFGVSQHNPLVSGTSLFDLSLYVDGLFVARQQVPATAGAPSDAVFFLPALDAGPHRFRLVWKNRASNTFLALHDIGFLSFSGPDADGDGVEDWRAARTDRLVSLGGPDADSPVSPICVEGAEMWGGTAALLVSSGTNSAEYATAPSVGGGFWADVPLDPDGAATTVELLGAGAQHSFSVAWTPYAIPDAATNAAFRLREGDALRLVGFPDAESGIAVERRAGEAWIAVTNFAASAPVPFAFDSAGLYRLSALAVTGGIPASAEAFVEAVASRFPLSRPAVVVGTARTLDAPALRPGEPVETDADLRATVTPAGEGSTLVLEAGADGEHGILSRLGEGGPVLDAARVTAIWGDNGSYYRVVENYPDGSQLAEVVLFLGSVPPDLVVKLEIFVAGVFFEDGTRFRELSAADFDEDGVCRIRFLRSAGITTSVCHYTRFYQGGVKIGSL
ncbi:MAG: hypothetical protein IJK04_02185 [Kiritimatiellae bacterium]|nr:hypothetical protein [Kiritimatiellia bacterium]